MIRNSVNHRHAVEIQRTDAGGICGLFNWENPQNIPDKISEPAMKTAIDFVDVSIQHAAYLAGRRDLRDEIEILQQIQLGIQVFVYTYHSHL